MIMVTAAEKRALEAVAAGRVSRIYRGDGNVLKGPPAVASATLWRLDRKGWLQDGRGGGQGPFRIEVPVDLSREGEAALAEARAAIG